MSLLSALGALGALGVLGIAEAEPTQRTQGGAEPLTLEWSAPAECPRRGEVVRAVMALVQEVRLARADHTGVAEEPPQVQANGRVTGSPDSGYVLRLAFAGAGHRELPGETCDAIAEVAALLLAIAVEPAIMGGELKPPAPDARPGPAPPPPLGSTSEDHVDPTEQKTPAPEDEEGEPATGPRSSSLQPSSADGDRPSTTQHEPELEKADKLRPVLGLKALGGLNLGVLPSPAAFAGLSLGIEWKHARFELHGSYAGPSRQSSTVNPEVGGRFVLWHAGVRGCRLLPLSRADTPRLSAPLCAGLHAGAIGGRGEGALIPQTAYSPWLGVSLAAALRAQLHRRVALWIEAEGLLSALRPRFHTDPTGALWQAGRAGGRFGLGLEIRFDLRRAASGGQ